MTERISKFDGRLTGTLLLALMMCTVLAFVPNVFDGTFPKAYLLYAFTALLVASSLAGWMRQCRVEIHLFPAMGFVLLYLLTGVLSMITAMNIRLSLESLLQLLSYAIVFYASVLSLNPRRLSSGLLVLTTITFVIALSYFLIPSTWPLYETARQVSKSSTFGNPSYFAGFLILTIPVIASQGFDSSISISRKGLSVGLAVVGTALLILTGSRSAYIAFIVMITFAGVLCLPTRTSRVLGPVVVFSMMIILLFMYREAIPQKIAAMVELSPQSSIIRRLYFYEGAWRAFLGSPLIGNGIGNFAAFLPRFRPADYWMAKSEDVVPHAHNEMLEILSETGCLGFLAFCIIIVIVARKLFRALSLAKGGDRAVPIALLAALAGLLTDAFFSMNLRTIPVALLFWMILGVGSGLSGPQGRIIAFSLPGRMRRVWPFPFILAILCAGLMVPGIVQRYSSEKAYLAGLIFRYENKKDEAAEQFGIAVNRNPHLAEANFYLAANLAERQEHQEALAAVNSLLHEYPYYPKVRIIKALSQFSSGDTAGAFASIHEELEIENSPQVYSLAAELCRLSNRPKEEYDFLTVQLRQNYRSGMKEYARDAIEHIGNVVAQLGMQEPTMKLLDTLGQKFSDDGLILISLGKYYVSMGELEKAKIYLDRARKIGESDPAIKQDLLDLESRIELKKP